MLFENEVPNCFKIFAPSTMTELKTMLYDFCIMANVTHQNLKSYDGNKLVM